MLGIGLGGVGGGTSHTVVPIQIKKNAQSYESWAGDNVDLMISGVGYTKLTFNLTQSNATYTSVQIKKDGTVIHPSTSRTVGTYEYDITNAEVINVVWSQFTTNTLTYTITLS